MCRTVTTGTTISWSIAPPWTNRAPPVKWKRLAPLGIQNSMSPSAPAVTLVLPCQAASWSGSFGPEQVSLLGHHRAVRLVVQLALVGLAGGVSVNRKPWSAVTTMWLPLRLLMM